MTADQMVSLWADPKVYLTADLTADWKGGSTVDSMAALTAD